MMKKTYQLSTIPRIVFILFQLVLNRNQVCIYYIILLGIILVFTIISTLVQLKYNQLKLLMKKYLQNCALKMALIMILILAEIDYTGNFLTSIVFLEIVLNLVQIIPNPHKNNSKTKTIDMKQQKQNQIKHILKMIIIVCIVLFYQVTVLIYLKKNTISEIIGTLIYFLEIFFLIIYKCFKLKKMNFEMKQDIQIIKKKDTLTPISPREQFSQKQKINQEQLINYSNKSYFIEESFKVKEDLESLMAYSVEVLDLGILILQPSKQKIEYELKYLNQTAKQLLQVYNDEDLHKFLLIEDFQIQNEQKLQFSEGIINSVVSSQVQDEAKYQKSKNFIQKLQHPSIANNQQFDRMFNSQNEFQQQISLKRQDSVLFSQPQNSILIQQSGSHKSTHNLKFILDRFIQLHGYRQIYNNEELKQQSHQEEFILSIQINNVILLTFIINQRKQFLKFQLNSLQLAKKYIILSVRNQNHIRYIENLQQQNKQKSKTISYVSHEFRTPLGCIITMLKQCKEDIPLRILQQKLLQDDKLNLNFYIESSLANAEYLLSLSNDLLDLAQIKVGKFKVQQTIFNLKQLCLQIIDLFQLQANQKNINLVLNYQCNNQMVYTDKNRIKQILINLLGNAFKFTQQGFVKLSVKELDIEIIEISVEDSGIGIKQENLKKLFKAFEKINSEESKKLNQQGVGLGLLISNTISKMLNIQNQGLYVSSEYMKGTKFSFMITKEKVESENEIMPENQISSHKMIPISEQIPKQYKIQGNQSRFKKPQKQNIQTCTCLNILIVDDTQFNIDALCLLLDRNFQNQLKIDKCNFGVIAVDMVKEKIKENCKSGYCSGYQLIFMDIEMPQQNGFETTKQILELYKEQKIKNIPKIIGCSGYESQTVKEECQKIGMNQYLTKPLDKSILISIINEIKMTQQNT